MATRIRKGLLIGLGGVGLCLLAALLLAAYRPPAPTWFSQLQPGMPTKEFLDAMDAVVMLPKGGEVLIQVVKEDHVVEAVLTDKEVRSVKLVREGVFADLRRRFGL